jgi:hypothetical protein
MLRRRLNPAYLVGDWTVPSQVPPSAALHTLVERSKKLYEKRVTLSVQNASPREILNQLVAAHGELGWAVSYELRTPSPQTPVSIEEATCVIRLIPFAGDGFVADLLPASLLVPPGVRGGPPPVPPAGPPPPTPAGGRVLAELPMDVYRMSTLLARLSTVLSASVGSEIVIDSPITATTAGGRPGPSSQAYDLTGLSLAAALSKVTEWMPEYAWTLDAGVHHLRPRAQNPVSQILDMKVDRFAGRYEDVRSAVLAVLDVIDKTVPGGPPAGRTVINSMTTPAPTEDMKKSTVFDLTGVTIRQLLDSLVTQHGRLSWTMEARRSGTGSTALQLRVYSFDGSTINAPPIVR